MGNGMMNDQVFLPMPISGGHNLANAPTIVSALGTPYVLESRYANDNVMRGQSNSQFLNKFVSFVPFFHRHPTDPQRHIAESYKDCNARRNAIPAESDQGRRDARGACRQRGSGLLLLLQRAIAAIPEWRTMAHVLLASGQIRLDHFHYQVPEPRA